MPPTPRTAPTDHPILPVLADRWSPRAYADRPVEPEKLASIFEAARWSSSSFNEQPWRFIVAVKDASADGGADYAKALGCLVAFNQSWARTAPVLIVTAARTNFARTGKPNRCAQHDLGQAVACLAAQATELGLHLHQMAGIELEKTREAWGIPAEFEPVTVIALGYLGAPDRLPEPLRAGENAPRIRKPLAEVVFSGAWEQPADFSGKKE